MSMLESSTRSRRHAAPTPRYLSRGSAAVAVATAPAPAPRPRSVPAARPNHLRVVPATPRVRRRLTPTTAVLLTAALFATLLAVAMAQTVLVQGQVRLDALDAQLTTEQARYQELRKDVAELESPARIVEAAHQQGMVTPDDLLYLQPPAPDPSAAGPTSGDAAEPAADPAAGAEDRAWSEVKPMLEAPAP
jgi:cell division protein FtsL